MKSLKLQLQQVKYDNIKKVKEKCEKEELEKIQRIKDKKIQITSRKPEIPNPVLITIPPYEKPEKKPVFKSPFIKKSTPEKKQKPNDEYEKVSKQEYIKILKKHLQSPQDIDVMDYDKICVFMFNTNGDLLLHDKKKLLLQSTSGTNPSVVIAIQLVIMNILGNILEPDEHNILTFSIKDEYICCYCFVNEENFCFPVSWVSFDSIESIPFDSEQQKLLNQNLMHLNRFRMFMLQTSVKEKREQLVRRNLMLNNGKTWINNCMDPQEYFNSNVKNVVLYLFNQDKKLCFLENDKQQLYFPHTPSTNGFLFLCLERYFERTFEKKINVIPYFMKMLYLQSIHTLIFFVVVNGNVPFTDTPYIDHELVDFEYQFLSLSKIKRTKCIESFSKQIFQVTMNDIQFYLENEFPLKKVIKNKN